MRNSHLKMASDARRGSRAENCEEKHENRGGCFEVLVSLGRRILVSKAAKNIVKIGRIAKERRMEKR